MIGIVAAGEPSQTGMTWQDVTFILGITVVVFFVGAFLVWQIFVTWRARAAVSREDAYRKLAEDISASQTRSADDLARTRAELTDIRERLAEIERMLREVE